MTKKKQKKNNKGEKHASINYNIHFSCLNFLLFIPIPSFGHIYINKNTTIEKEEKEVSSLAISTPKQTKKRRRRRKKIKHTECTKEKVFDFLCFLDSVSYHIVHMIWWKREEKKKTIWNNNAHTHTH